MIIFSTPLNGCNHDVLCVKVSEACFDRSMHDLLHTSTLCHFKICLESHYFGVLGYSFILRLCRRWNEGSLYNSLTCSVEGHGFGRLSVTRLHDTLPKTTLPK